MKTRAIAIAAIVLWLVTVLAAATLFVRGRTAPATDGRASIVLEHAERDLVLEEMRGMLRSVQGIAAGLAQQDSEAVARNARLSGSAAAAAVPVTLMAKLPLEFKRMGMAAHGGFDELAVAAEQGETADMLLDRLATQLSNCVACHATYRLDAANAGGR